MRLSRPAKRPVQDPTIALINIVFLMLIFFLLAGTLAPGRDKDISLIRTQNGERSQPPVDPVSVTADGVIRYGGETSSRTQLIERLSAFVTPTANGPATSIEIFADQKLKARQLIELLRALKTNKVEARIITRAGGQ